MSLEKVADHDRSPLGIRCDSFIALRRLQLRVIYQVTYEETDAGRAPEEERTSDGFISCGSAKPWEIASGWLAGPFVIETAKRFCFLRLVSLGEPYPSRLWSTPPLDDMHDNALPSRQTANKGFFEG